MTIQPEHRALIFVAAIAVLGAGVRVARAVTGRPSIDAQPGLEHQMQAADSAAKAAPHRSPGRGGRPPNTPRPTLASSQDTGSAGRARRHTGSRPPTGRTARDSAAALGGAPLDRVGYVGGKLDLDVATAAQIDSLPGVSPAIAKRIAADRVRRGPFLSRDGLRRVSGVGPRFLAQIDSLVTFSGTFVAGAASDTIIPPRSASRPTARRGRAPPS